MIRPPLRRRAAFYDISLRIFFAAAMPADVSQLTLHAEAEHAISLHMPDTHTDWPFISILLIAIR